MDLIRRTTNDYVPLSSEYRPVRSGKKVNMACCTSTKKAVVFGVGACLFVLGVIMASCWFLIFHAIIAWQLALTPTSTSYDMWEDTPIPMYADFYLFNWTNAEEFSEPDIPPGLKPTFTEMGPYVFSEHHTKVNITWNNNNTVTFQQIRVWHFQEDMSNGSLDDLVTNINVIATAVGYMTRYELPIVRVVLDGLLQKCEKKIYVTKTVRELLFDGYDDKLLDLTKKFNITKFNIPFDKFAWFKDRNNSDTYDGWYNMYTGTDNLEHLGMLNSWNFETRTTFYRSTCGDVHGSTGELWPPVEDRKEVSVFSSDICGSLGLKYRGEGEVAGITGNHYEGDATNFDNGSEDPNKSCYVSGEPTVSGTLNVSLCKWNAPAFVSYPHFFLADRSYRDAVEGMEPDPAKHSFTMTLEPNTGIPLQVRARVQISILLQPYEDLTFFQSVPRVFIPAMWFVQRADISGSLTDKANLVVAIRPAGLGVSVALAVLGAIIVLVGLIISYRHRWSGEDKTLLISGAAPRTESTPVHT